MSVISSSFNCRTSSASSFPTSFRVFTGAAVASVTPTAGYSSSLSASVLTEETLALSVVKSLQTPGSCRPIRSFQGTPAQVTSEHPHAFTPLLFPPEKLGEPLWPGAHPECFKQGRLQGIVIVRLLDVHGSHYAPHLRISMILDKGCSSLLGYTGGSEVHLHMFEPGLHVRRLG
ncbi:hypothetical protein D917_03931 [Trichinella nativa]|uniref:Uncharacterized protein n=1 Tax=Trichinella nativa TaxID=6335 RepID=A0A1Y3EAL2_9BILA|nr:hypothetical protein D917_03931 [Trichinella nativa]